MLLRKPAPFCDLDHVVAQARGTAARPAALLDVHATSQPAAITT